MQGILVDLDGVVYEGDRAVPGAAEAVAWILSHGIPFLFLTNTTSRPSASLLEKLAGLGIRTGRDRLLTPPLAARSWLAQNAPGPAALFVPSATRCEFAGLAVLHERAGRGAASVVVGDLGRAWTFAKLNRAFRLLMQEPAPVLVALGMTRYWRARDGLRLDVAPFVKALEHASARRAVVLGKPSPHFFGIALERIGCRAGEACMVGDDIVGDVQAAQRLGMQGLLVRTGKFRERDLEDDIHPHAVLDSIADLPRWWEDHA